MFSLNIFLERESFLLTFVRANDGRNATKSTRIFTYYKIFIFYIDFLKYVSFFLKNGDFFLSGGNYYTRKVILFLFKSRSILLVLRRLVGTLFNKILKILGDFLFKKYFCTYKGLNVF